MISNHKKNRLLSAFLAIVMTVMMLPVNTSATGEGDIVLGTAGIQAYDKIYFGQYASGGAYNVPWFVLNKTADSATLLSEYILRSSAFRTGLYGYYTESTLSENMRSLYYDYDANLLFNTKEKTAVSTTTLTGDSMYHGQSDLTGQLLYALSYSEAESIGWDNPILLARYIHDQSGSAGEWWLRSSSLYNEAWAIGNTYSEVTHRPYIIKNAYDSSGVRPVFSLNLDSVLFSSAAAAGKISGTEGADALTRNLPSTDITQWKLTLLDTSRSSFDIATTSLTATAATISYQGAATGETEYISAMIVNDTNDVLYYGRIKRLPNTADASGSVTINIPSDITLGTNATLKVFNEQCNGDFKTDFSSQQITVTGSSASPVISTTELPSATAGIPYAYTMAVNGGINPYTFSVIVSTLPDGLTLSTAGAILGTPTVSGNFTFSIMVQDANEAQDTKEFTMTVNPADSATGEGDIVLGTAGIQAYDKIYFGQYASGGAYNVPWFVLNKTADSATLLSEYILRSSTFRTGLYGYYTESTLSENMRSLYYDYGANLLFNAKEKTAVSTTTLTGDSMYPGQSDLTGQLLYALSYSEAESIGSDNPILIARYIHDQSGSAGEWWLRSSSLYNEAWAIGNIYSEVTHRPYIIKNAYDSSGVRPVFNLNLDSVLFSSAAAAGKISGTEGADALTRNLPSTDITQWKLTLLDTGRSGFDITTTSLTATAATISYQGAAIGETEYISAMIVNDANDVLYYGRIKRLPNTADASGNVTINIPSDITLGTNATLKVFNEQCNGDFKTDFSSQQITVTSTVETPPANACEIGTTQYATFEEALAAVTSGQTIKLLDNVTYTSPVVIDSKTIYFDLGSYNLVVDLSEDDSWAPYAVTVTNGGKIRLSGTGTGKFNVIGSSTGNGVNVLGWNSEITVNNVNAPATGAIAVRMYGSGSYLDGGRITVNGNIVAGNTGIQVNARNGNITVNGDITAGHEGISIATNPGTSLTLTGNITVLGTEAQDQEGSGVHANGGSTVNVSGNVNVQGINNIGVFAYGGTIIVGGNVVSSGIGAKAEKNYSYGDGSVTINGSLSSGIPFIVVGTIDKTYEQNTIPTTKSGYLTYTNSTSTVWIASVGDRVYSTPAAPQNFNALSGDSQVLLSWQAPLNDGGRAISTYQVSKDNGTNWTDAGLNTSYTFSGLTNGTSYTFKVRAVNSEGFGLEAYTEAMPRAYAVRIGETRYAALNEALAAIGTGETATITLLKNIDHNSGISLNNKKVIFELNGYTLNVVSSSEYVSALDVYNGGGVALSGEGALNVTGPASACAVTVNSYSALSQVTVTNATAIGPDSKAVHAYGNVSLVVLGDVVATGPRSFGVHAQEGSVIEVRGNVSAGNQGVCVSGGTAKVIGNVTANGLDIIDNPEGIGVNVYDGVAEVGGNINANRIGAMIRAGGSIQVEGTITSSEYIQFNDDDPVLIESYITPTTKAGYRTYNVGDNTVWVKGETVTYSYSITVQNDGNGTGSSDLQTASQGQEITLTASPVSGYVFRQWDVISGEVTVTANKFVMPGTDVTVKAVFEPIAVTSHTVSFNSDNSLYMTRTVASGTSIGAEWPDNPVKNGYSFNGWFTSQDGAGVNYTGSDIINADTQLYAKWTINQYTITFNTAGGTVVSSITQNYGTAVTAPVNPTKTGYTFAGWNQSVPASMPANDIALTAQWTINQYTITFNTAGGTVVSSITQNYGTAVTAPVNPTKEGYTFSRWDISIPATMPANNITITAQWTYNIIDTPEIPAYIAYVKVKNGNETTLPIIFDTDSKNASVEGRLQDFDNVITVPSIPNFDKYTVSIPVSDLSSDESRKELTVNTDAGSITIPSDMLANMPDISGDKAQITIDRVDKSNLPDDLKKAVGTRPLVKLTLSIDGKQTNWSDEKTRVTVTIPYTPTEKELKNPEKIVVWYIDGENNIISVPNGKYDPDTKTVTFSTTHFSYYSVGYNDRSFNDVANDSSYAKAVSFISARGITLGMGDGNFNPEEILTRGQCIVMLMRAYGISLDSMPVENFADAGNTYYTDYLLTAKGLKIVNGVGNNMFAPEKQITRQEVLVMLYNTLRVINNVPKGIYSVQLTDYADGSYVPDWAKEALTNMGKAGINSDNSLNASSSITRAQFALMLYDLLSK